MKDYFKTRGEAVDKLIEKPGKDGEACQPKEKIEDQWVYLVEIDVDMYVQLQRNLRTVQQLYMIVGDVIEKNEEKLTKPKGDRNQSRMMY